MGLRGKGPDPGTGGRPPQQGEPRRKLRRVRLTPSDDSLIDRYAAELGETWSEFVRTAALQRIATIRKLRGE